MKIDIVESASQDDRQLVERALIDHATDAGIEQRNYRPLSVFLRDDGNSTVGGIIGATVWGWLEIKLLWVSAEHRDQGFGTKLVRAAEAEAERRGCHHALVDTFDFQARGFYERMGYERFGRLDDYPKGHARFFFQKQLIPG